ncbi:MAG: LicD family protein, partial [Candidatus Gastranaerophilales bacterium]|nr:LicD family protein [Candidatus Gastranaerophilales bacterium]
QIQRSNIIKQKRTHLIKECKNITDRKIIENKLNQIMQDFIPQNNISKNTDIVWGAEFNYKRKNWFFKYDTIFPLKTIAFEDYHFKCINNPQQYLKDVYGNYMTYPQKLGSGHSMYAKFSTEEENNTKDLANTIGRL